MEQIPDANVPRKNQRIFWTFYFAAIFLLLGAIAVTCVQKHYESTAARTTARKMQRQHDIKEQRESSPAVVAAEEVDIQQLIRHAVWWRNIGVVAFLFAMLSCGFAYGIARRHYEKQRWVWVPVIVLLLFYVWLELLMV